MKRRREKQLLRWQEDPLPLKRRSLKKHLLLQNPVPETSLLHRALGLVCLFSLINLGLLLLPLKFWGIGCHHHPWLPMGSSSILLSPLLSALNKQGSYSSLKNHLKEPFLFTIGHDGFYCWSSWMVLLSTALKNWQNHFLDISWT